MDIKELEHLAELSKLHFTEEELQDLSNEIAGLVELADEVKNCTIDGSANLTCVDMDDLRDDVAMTSTPSEVLLKNSPIVKKDSFVVPRIME